MGYRNITLVEIDGIGCLNDVIKVVLGDATDRELSVLPRQVPRDVNPGRECGDVEAFRNAKGIHLLTGKSIYRNGDFLQVLLSLLSDDNHLFKNVLCHEWAGQSGACNGADYGFAEAGVSHIYSPLSVGKQQDSPFLTLSPITD